MTSLQFRSTKSSKVINLKPRKLLSRSMFRLPASTWSFRKVLSSFTSGTFSSSFSRFSRLSSTLTSWLTKESISIRLFSTGRLWSNQFLLLISSKTFWWSTHLRIPQWKSGSTSWSLWSMWKDSFSSIFYAWFLSTWYLCLKMLWTKKTSSSSSSSRFWDFMRACRSSTKAKSSHMSNSFLPRGYRIWLKTSLTWQMISWTITVKSQHWLSSSILSAFLRCSFSSWL